MRTNLSEEKESLWMLAASPLIWAAHFLGSYATAAVWCAKLAGRGFGPARIAIAALTLVAIAGIAVVGWRGWKRHRHGDATLPHDSDSPEDRHRFLGFATVLLSGLSAVAIGFETIAVVLVGSCR